MRAKLAAISAAASGGATSTVLGTISVAALAGTLWAPPAAFAADTGELWEVSTQMNMPGMPAGMGGTTQKVCRDKDQKKAVTSRPDMKDCTVSDVKESGTRMTMTMSCPSGQTVMDFTYNASRTEYKGTIRMTGKNGEMTMNTSGRKLGACDAQEARNEREAMVAKSRADSDRMKADVDKQMRQSEETQIQACNKAADSMDAGGLGQYGRCYRKTDDSCKSIMSSYSKHQPKVAEACNAKVSEFCRRYQTQEGFAKVGRDRSKLSNAAEVCGVPEEKVRESLCTRAAQAQSYDFVGGYCPEQARPLAKEHCAGRSYTASEGDPRRVDQKWFKFCGAVAASLGNSEEDEPAKTDGKKPSPSKKTAAASEDSEQKKTPGEAINQGINKLKGLFGR
jgi:hypothetical protein